MSQFHSSLCAQFPINEKEERQDKSYNYGKLVDAYIKGRKAYSEEIYNYIANALGKEKKVLDLGCGTGISTFPLIKRFQEVQGCDPDPQMLEIAKKASSTPDLFKRGSAYELPYEDGKFGLVTMFSSFHWFCNATAINEISRVLEKRGFICIVDGIGRPLENEARKVIESIVGIKAEYPKGTSAFENVLIENEFIIIAKSEFRVRDEFTIEEALQRYQSSSIWHNVKNLGKEEEVISKLKELFLKNANSQGIVCHQHNEVVIIAQKKN